MTTEKMTIHRALAELKTIDSRIMKEIETAKFCTAAKNGETKLFGAPALEFIENGKSTYDKIMSLIARKNALKRGVSKSNAVTEVEINGEKMTVAEAISMKQHGIETKKMLYDEISQQYARAVQAVETQNARLEQKADEMIKVTFAANDKNQVTEDTIAKVRAAYLEPLQFRLFDSVDCKQKIEALDEEISKFEADVDAVLSVSNATTEIEISY